MKLEQQVVSLDLAKRLKELGAEQESLFYWHVEPFSDNDRWTVSYLGNIDKPPFIKERAFMQYSAFTVAELGEMLPDHLEDNGESLFCDKSSDEYRVWYADENGENYPFNYEGSEFPDNIPAQISKTEADARAKMLVYLLENKLVSPTKQREEDK